MRGLFYISPWLIGTIFFVVYPFAATIYLSLTDYDLFNAPNFIGLTNYINIFTQARRQDAHFVESIWVTMRYSIFTVPAQLAFALFIAIILNMKIKGINFFRTAYFIPSILGGNIAISILWRYLFSGQGLVNQALGVFGMGPVGWLSTPGGAMFIISLLRVWQFGSAMVIFLAALKAVPEELYDSAKVDGASKMRTFWKITVPMISPTIFFNLVLQLNNAMQEFNAPFMVTQGGPMRATNFTSMMIYDHAFRFFNMGYASAMSWILFIIIMIGTGIIFGTNKRWVYYADGGDGK